MTDYAELRKRLRRYPAIREEAWRLYDEGFCYDDEMDNAPIEVLAVEAADALDTLALKCVALETYDDSAAKTNAALQARIDAALKECDSIDEMAKMGVPPESHNCTRWLRAALATAKADAE